MKTDISIAQNADIGKSVIDLRMIYAFFKTMFAHKLLYFFTNFQISTMIIACGSGTDATYTFLYFS